MAAAVQAVAELIKMGGPWALVLLTLGWAVAERVHNIREGRANAKALIDLSMAQIAATTKLESAVSAQQQMQRELMLITLGKRSK